MNSKSDLSAEKARVTGTSERREQIIQRLRAQGKRRLTIWPLSHMAYRR